jgi:hypothetical protein
MSDGCGLIPVCRITVNGLREREWKWRVMIGREDHFG